MKERRGKSYDEKYQTWKRSAEETIEFFQSILV